MMTPSASRGRAPVLCPVCNDDSEGLAVVGHAEDERGAFPTLEDFSCPSGHTWRDLSLEQERRILESACEWLDSALDAMESAHFDLKMDAARDGD